MVKQLLGTIGEDQLVGPMSRAFTVANMVSNGTSDCELAHDN